MSTWRATDAPAQQRIGLAGWALAALRGTALVLVILAGLVLLLALRLVEQPLFGRRRPWTPAITRGVCRVAFPVLGIGYRVTGAPMRQIGAVVSNHVSWLDIFALNGCQRLYFVAKAEVAGWLFVGWLARATGTVFIRRDPRDAVAQKAVMEARLRAGHHLLFFPEGTSTDGLRVLPFKSTLFSAFFTPGLEREMLIQPVSLIYRAPKAVDARFYGWWGDMTLAPHMLKVLSRWRQGEVEVVFHAPVAVNEFDNRKVLAAHCEGAVRSVLPWV